MDKNKHSKTFIPPNPADWTSDAAISLLRTKIFDDYIAYHVVKMMVQDWKEMDAYKNGFIDEHGKILTKRADMTAAQKKKFSKLDLVIINMKKTILKYAPYSIYTWAQALHLIKEEIEQSDLTDIQVAAYMRYLQESVRLAEEGEGGGVSGSAPTNTTTNTGVSTHIVVKGKKPKVQKRKPKLHECVTDRDTLKMLREYAIENPSHSIVIEDEDGSRFFVKY